MTRPGVFGGALIVGRILHWRLSVMCHDAFAALLPVAGSTAHWADSSATELQHIGRIPVQRNCCRP